MKNTTKNILLAGLFCLVSSPVYSAAIATPADMARLRDMPASIEAVNEAKKDTIPVINNDQEIDAANKITEARNTRIARLVRQFIAARRLAAGVNTPEALAAALVDDKLDPSFIDAEKQKLVDAANMLAAKALEKSNTDSDSSDNESEEKDTISFLQKAKAKFFTTKQAASAKVGAWYNGACDLANDTTIAIHDRTPAVVTSLAGVAVAGKKKTLAFANATGRGIATVGSSARRALTSKPAKIAYGVTAAALVAYIARVMYTVGNQSFAIQSEPSNITAAEALHVYWTNVLAVIDADTSACAEAFRGLPDAAKQSFMKAASAINANAIDPILNATSSVWNAILTNVSKFKGSMIMLIQKNFDLAAK